MLTEDNEWQCVAATCEFLQAYETNVEEFLDSIAVTGDKTWEVKQQCHQWK